MKTRPLLPVVSKATVTSTGISMAHKELSSESVKEMLVTSNTQLMRSLTALARILPQEYTCEEIGLDEAFLRGAIMTYMLLYRQAQSDAMKKEMC